MEAVKVSPKYQVVIPLEIRRSLGIRPGTVDSLTLSFQLKYK